MLFLFFVLANLVQQSVDYCINCTNTSSDSLDFARSHSRTSRRSNSFYDTTIDIHLLDVYLPFSAPHLELYLASVCLLAL